MGAKKLQSTQRKSKKLTQRDTENHRDTQRKINTYYLNGN